MTAESEQLMADDRSILEFDSDSIYCGCAWVRFDLTVLANMTHIVKSAGTTNTTHGEPFIMIMIIIINL